MRDKPSLRPGKPTEAVTPTMVANVEVFVNKDHNVTFQELANIKLALVKHWHIRFTLGMSKISARRESKQLTEDRQQKNI